MRIKPLSMDSFTETMASINYYNNESDGSDDVKHRKMLCLLRNIMNGELTEKQKRCVFLYYGEMMKMKDVADEMGISVSSVSRHIKKARTRIEKTMKYYF